MLYKRLIIIISLILFLLFLVINLHSLVKIEGDGVFYYSWLRSTVIDHDFDFYNELKYFASYDIGSQRILADNLRTDTGHVPSPYAYGTALLWLPLFVVASLVSWLFNLSLDGYSWFYVFFVNLSSWLFGLAAFLIVYFNLKKYFTAAISFWSTLGIYLSTPWFYYQFFEPSMSHMASLFIVCVFFDLVIKFHQGIKVHTGFLAVVVFIMVAVRWQNLLFLIILLPLFWHSRHNAKLFVTRLISIFLPVAIFWITQSLIWKYLYGYYFLQPQGRGFVRLDLHGLYILFSSNRGLLLWSPIIILAFCGFYFLYKKSKFLFFISLSAFTVQWLINGSLNDLGGGDAYGARRFIETLPFLSLALAAFWSNLKSRQLMIIVTVIFIIWNMILIQNYRHNQIPHHGEFPIFKINYFNAIISSR